MNDIEILEKYIKDKTIKSMGGLVTPDKEELQAIENLINRVKELEEENKYLKEQIPTDKIFYYSYKDYIPKSKIKEMIKDLELFDAEFFDVETLKLVTKNSLQELLEE